MLLSGDELGNSQGGNNNAYCQDNKIGWIDWRHASEEKEFLAFVRELLRLRREHPAFRRTRFLRGRSAEGEAGVEDIVWLNPDGNEMDDEDWNAGENHFLGFQLSGSVDSLESPAESDDFLVLLNANHEEVIVTLPRLLPEARWETVLDTDRPADSGSGVFKPGDEYRLLDRSVAVLSNVRRVKNEG